MDKLIKEFILSKNCKQITLNKEIDKINRQTNHISYKIGEKRYNIYRGNPKGTKKNNNKKLKSNFK